MKLDEYIQNMRWFREALPEWLYAVLNQYASHVAVAAIIKRVTTRQLSHQGIRFSKYSTKPYYTTGRDERGDKVYKAVAGTKEQRKNLKWITAKDENGNMVPMFLLEGGYKQYRDIDRGKAYSSPYKSFELTTQMWRHFGVIRHRGSKNLIVITIGGKNREAQKKININSEREGIPIIGMSDKEILNLERYVERAFEKMIKQYRIK